MADEAPSRREFLWATGGALGALWLSANLPALHAAGLHAATAVKTSSRSFEFFSAEEAADFEAIAALIFPSDGTPGAKEAGVVHFADRALSTFLSPMAEGIRGGLAQLNAGLSAHVSGPTRFSLLSRDRQEEALRGIEPTPLFGAFRMLTLAGMFANPSYGGNQNKVGWHLLGFEDRFAYQPPFGYYDRGYSDRDTHQASGAE